MRSLANTTVEARKRLGLAAAAMHFNYAGLPTNLPFSSYWFNPQCYISGSCPMAGGYGILYSWIEQFHIEMSLVEIIITN
jgi:hypothetical protein